MFTGIIEEVGTVNSVFSSHSSKELIILCKKVLEGTKIGDSIAIDGVCQTVVEIIGNRIKVEVLQQTIVKTTLKKLKVASKVNLERAITLNRPFGGHFVQGHVQGVGYISSITKLGVNTFLSIKLPIDILKFVVKEGSITVNGLSLTVADIKGFNIVINIIPHTLKETTVLGLKVGDEVNIEPDMLLKSVITKKETGLTKEKLLGWGY